MSKIVVIGAGGFGTALAVLFDSINQNVILYSAFEAEINLLKNDKEHKKLLPGVKISDSILLTTDLSVVNDCDICVFAVPSFAVREVAKSVKGYIKKETVVVNVGKGLEENSLKTLSQVIGEELNRKDIVVLSGPSHAEEIATGIPTTLVAACANKTHAEYIQDEFTCNSLRIYVNDDVLGVELGGALKNIIALCAGIADGMKLGDNTKAALITRGLAEIARLGTRLGAQKETFAGLSGVGDLIVTCMSMHSRNRRAGILIGQGVSTEEALMKVGTVEGIYAAKAAYKLSKKMGVTMPIVEQLHYVIENQKCVKEALFDLMDRPTRHEKESIWLNNLL